MSGLSSLGGCVEGHYEESLAMLRRIVFAAIVVVTFLMMAPQARALIWW